MPKKNELFQLYLYYWYLSFGTNKFLDFCRITFAIIILNVIVYAIKIKCEVNEVNVISNFINHKHHL